MFKSGGVGLYLLFTSGYKSAMLSYRRFIISYFNPKSFLLMFAVG